MTTTNKEQQNGTTVPFLLRNITAESNIGTVQITARRVPLKKGPPYNIFTRPKHKEIQIQIQPELKFTYSQLILEFCCVHTFNFSPKTKLCLIDFSCILYWRNSFNYHETSVFLFGKQDRVKEVSILKYWPLTNS